MNSQNRLTNYMQQSHSREGRSCSANQERLPAVWMNRVHYSVNKSPQLIPILNQIILTHALPFCFIRSIFNIIFPFILIFSKRSFLFSNQNPVCISLLSHICHRPRPFFCWGVQTIQLLAIQFIVSSYCGVQTDNVFVWPRCSPLEGSCEHTNEIVCPIKCEFLISRETSTSSWKTLLHGLNYLPHGAESFKEANRSSASQEILRILLNPKVHYRIHKRPPPFPIVCQLDPVHTPTSYFLKIHLNIILSSSPESSKCCISLRFPHQTPVYASPLPHRRYMPRSFHSSRFDHPNSIGWGVQITFWRLMSTIVVVPHR